MTIDEDRDNDRDKDQLILRLAPPDRWAALSRRPYSSTGVALSVDEYGRRVRSTIMLVDWEGEAPAEPGAWNWQEGRPAAQSLS